MSGLSSDDVPQPIEGTEVEPSSAVSGPGEPDDETRPERRDPAVRRDEAAEHRDEAGTARDRAGVQRDVAGAQRDRAGERRDEAAEARDEADRRADSPLGATITAEIIERSTLSRRAAATDRAGAAHDRRAGADERTMAQHDRETALADRGASAVDRESWSLDALTGAYQRGAGFVELEREMARARRSEESLVVAFLDVDGLKSVNDLHGHARGDRMLRSVVDALRGGLRSHDLIIRYGGDEFVCAAAGLSVADAAERLRWVNRTLARLPERAAVTVGLAELRPGDSAEDLLARADDALYEKRQRKGPAR